MLYHERRRFENATPRFGACDLAGFTAATIKLVVYDKRQGGQAVSLVSHLKCDI